MITLTTPIADAIVLELQVLELQDFRENHEYEKNQTQAAIASGDFVRASRSMHESMIWQYNQRFANNFTLEKLDSITGSLLVNVLSTVSNPRAADLAQQDAWKEQYKFCLIVQKMIARRAAQA